MSQPKIADTKPAVLDLEPGTYWWCQCGLSENQPWCDGSHKTTDFTPEKLELDSAKRVALCVCKQSDNPPYCDGTHAKL